MAKLTRQEIFDRCFQGIMKQQAFSYSSEADACYYRHPNNPTIRCHIGLLMPDETYDPSFEQRGVLSLFVHYINDHYQIEDNAFTRWAYDNFNLSIKSPANISSASLLDYFNTNSEDDADFLRHLQQAHDFVASKRDGCSSWPEQKSAYINEMKTFAATYNLYIDIMREVA